VIGTGAGYQAEHLMAEGFPFECLVDPEARFYEAVGIGRIGVAHWFRPSVIRRYVTAFGRGGRQGKITGDWRRLSGVAVIEPDRTVRYLFRASGVGDYPPVADLLEALGPTDP
jgi:AhpC/TSA antioxidant enzyme